MKQLICIYALIQILASPSWGQIVFNKNYYLNATNSRANAVLATSDDGYLSVGTSYNASAFSVIKTNIVGDTLWTSFFPYYSNYGHYFNTAIETLNGDYIMGGTAGDSILLRSHAVLIKYKATGDTLWMRKIGLPNRSERCYSVKQTVDGGFVFCGLRYNEDGSGNITDSDVYLVKTDSSGYPQWEKVFGGTNYDWGLSIELTNEGGYMIFGNTYSYGVGNCNMYLIKTDSIGNMIWQKTYGGNLSDYGASILKTNDNNYTLAGSTSITSDTVAAYVLKIDTAGTVIWERKYKGRFNNSEFNAIKEIPSGELIVCGDLQADSLNYRYYGTLKKLNSNGYTIWEKQYQYFNTDTTQHYFYAMDLANDGGFIMAGMSRDLHYGVTPTNGMWLVKTDANGCDSTACYNVSISTYDNVKGDLLIYPNPAQSQITIEYDVADTKNTLLEIKNILGQTVYSQKIKNVIGRQIISIDLSGFSSGVYFVSVLNKIDGSVAVSKFIKE